MFKILKIYNIFNFKSFETIFIFKFSRYKSIIKYLYTPSNVGHTICGILIGEWLGPPKKKKFFLRNYWVLVLYLVVLVALHISEKPK